MAKGKKSPAPGIDARLAAYVANAVLLAFASGRRITAADYRRACALWAALQKDDRGRPRDSKIDRLVEYIDARRDINIDGLTIEQAIERAAAKLSRLFGDNRETLKKAYARRKAAANPRRRRKKTFLKGGHK